MKYIKFILGIQACILGLLFIVWMMGELALTGMELDMMFIEYDYMMEEVEYNEQVD